MTNSRLALVLALILGIGVIAGGIVYAQSQTQTNTDVIALDDLDDIIDDQDPGTARTFSLFMNDGAFLGVGTENISKENMGRYGMREVRGVAITQVMKDSPAEKAGLRKDDVILRFDGESVTSTRKLSRLVSESSADQTVRLTISRAGAEQEISATLGKHDMTNVFRTLKPGFEGRINDQVWRGLSQGDWPLMNQGDGNFLFSFGANRRIGVGTQPLTKQLAEYFGAPEGALLITSVTENSPAAKAGLKAGDVITAIDGEKVTSPGDIARVINKKQDGEVSLTIVRDRSLRTINLTPEKRPDPSVLRPGTVGTRRVVIPSIRIEGPQITIPSIDVPSIDVTVPSKPMRVRKTRTVII